jgi:hypothetical protein
MEDDEPGRRGLLTVMLGPRKTGVLTRRSLVAVLVGTDTALISPDREVFPT